MSDRSKSYLKQGKQSDPSHQYQFFLPLLKGWIYEDEKLMWMIYRFVFLKYSQHQYLDFSSKLILQRLYHKYLPNYEEYE